MKFRQKIYQRRVYLANSLADVQLGFLFLKLHKCKGHQRFSNHSSSEHCLVKKENPEPEL